MGPERRRQLLLGVLLVVLLGVLYRVWSDRYVAPGQAAGGSSIASGPRAAAGTTAAAQPAPAVHLDELQRDRPKPSTAERDLFRFRPKAAPAAAFPGRGAQAGPPVPTGPPPPPPPPPIALKFIGLVDQGPGKPKLAVLSDGLGPPMYGVEGGTVAGRYRIVRIGAESIEMEYLDGHGRQTIRLSGS